MIEANVFLTSYTTGDTIKGTAVSPSQETQAQKVQKLQLWI